MADEGAGERDGVGLSARDVHRVAREGGRRVALEEEGPRNVRGTSARGV